MRWDENADKTKEIEGTGTFITPPTNPYPTNPYTINPYAPPPPRKRVPVMNILLVVVGLLLVGSIIFVGIHGIPLHQPQTQALTSTPTPSPSLSSTATITPGTTSKSPLLYQNSQSQWDCYVLEGSEDNIPTFAVMTNSASSIVQADCNAVLGQGNYTSTSPQKIVAGDKLQCQGWGADNTSWTVEAEYNDLSTSMFCHDLSQVVPPVQG